MPVQRTAGNEFGRETLRAVRGLDVVVDRLAGTTGQQLGAATLTPKVNGDDEADLLEKRPEGLPDVRVPVFGTSRRVARQEDAVEADVSDVSDLVEGILHGDEGNRRADDPPVGRKVLDLRQPPLIDLAERDLDQLWVGDEVVPDAHGRVDHLAPDPLAVQVGDPRLYVTSAWRPVRQFVQGRLELLASDIGREFLVRCPWHR